MANRRGLLLVNTNAREGLAGFEPAIAYLRENGVTLIDAGLDDPDKIPEIISRHQTAVDCVIVGGGDGTMNTAADALLETKLPLGILPLGTANDLARTLQIPFDLAEACAVIAGGRLHAIDVGRVNGKCFFNVASIGLSVQVAQALTPAFKRRWGVLAYPLRLLAGIRANRSFRAEIRCGTRTLVVRSIQVAVGNGRHYGGGMTVADDATIDDHRLDLYSIPPMSLWRLLLLAGPLRRGEHRHTEVRLLHGRDIEVRTRRPMPVNTDGELTTHTPARFEILPAAISVFVPETYPEKSTSRTIGEPALLP